ncbi:MULTISPECIES: HAMP domain-containing sensor histidine kinase [Cellulomonas]|uniref:Signal transduction histidine-protein kinase/phosphatase MprB n=1 Tax=Cellulomonas iranensis TaxID=76862 RepID=A0ABU0GHI9_9CELL|nr:MULTISPECIES: HAMP domain-containing sensor histidine kinase [Cellulomonas]MBO9567543.1 HAMP domain-containing histidine kinase [Cellulomonas iranensis]MDQ0424090.1 signal transduction histidine kinase [Cellulomonas iranensis]TFH72885.1 HAMP domain-containing histidine kinase [Cellulomonas sp. HD19AZ1]UCN13649.1 HAMP domain-containing histidine kinase [Cellulomonas iranensis]
MTSPSSPPARHVRGDDRWHLPDVRPLDPLRSIKIKLGVLVASTVTIAAFVIWWGYGRSLGPSRTLPLAIVLSLILTQLLARGMTSPLREMTVAARAMAAGDYSRRVRSTSRDEVGQLAEAFNTMADDLQQLDTFRRELVANVSHELRTPVTALQAQLENMVDGVSEPDPATLATALAQTERLSRLVSSLLDLSRVEAGAMELRTQDVPLADLLGEAADEASLVGAAKRLRFGVDVEPADLTVPADPERLHQVVANLLQNAARHSPEDDEVQVVARRVGEDVQIDVVDHGPGIAREQRAHVFERFVRGNTPALTGQGSTGGTGLGLAIVRWAVELHGGSVEVADSASGCTMRVRLPATPATRA